MPYHACEIISSNQWFIFPTEFQQNANIYLASATMTKRYLNCSFVQPVVWGHCCGDDQNYYLQQLNLCEILPKQYIWIERTANTYPFNNVLRNGVRSQKVRTRTMATKKKFHFYFWMDLETNSLTSNSWLSSSLYSSNSWIVFRIYRVIALLNCVVCVCDSELRDIVEVSAWRTYFNRLVDVMS